MKKLIFIAVILLNGCIKLLPDPKPPATKLWIDSDPNTKNTIEFERLIKFPKVRLVLARPYLPTYLESRKIQVIEYRNNVPTLTFLNDYELPVSLGDLLIQHLIKYHAVSNQFLSVMSSETDNNGTHLLKTAISRWDLDLTSKPHLRIEGQFTLVDNQNAKIMAQHYFKHTFSLQQVSIEAITKAYTQAFDQLNHDSEQFLKVYFN